MHGAVSWGFGWVVLVLFRCSLARNTNVRFYFTNVSMFWLLCYIQTWRDSMNFFSSST